MSGDCQLTDEEETLHIVQELSRRNEEHMEAVYEGHRAWSTDKMHPNTLRLNLQNIQGVSLTLRDAVVKRKVRWSSVLVVEVRGRGRAL